MSSISISNILSIFLLLFLYSCQKVNFFENEKESSDFIFLLEKENDETISNLKDHSSYIFNDYYSKDNNFNLKKNTSLNKIFSLTITKQDYKISNLSNFILDDNFIYFIDDKLNFNIINLSDGKQSFKTEIKTKVSNKLLFPIYISKLNDYLFASLSNGLIFKFDKKGKIIWEYNSNQILKTPIKIYNDEIILISNSNKIFSLDSIDGNLLWQQTYELNKPSSSYGGNIISKNNIIYFKMPNGRIGAIDTIFSEKILPDLIQSVQDENIFNNNYDAYIHVYKNLFSILENNKKLNSFDLINNEKLVDNFILYNINSFNFINNTLNILDNDLNYISLNIKNSKYFWKINLSEYLKNNDKIINSYINDNTLYTFFSNGLFINQNILNGEITFFQNLKLSKIYNVSSFNNVIMITLTNGKTVFFKQ